MDEKSFNNILRLLLIIIGFVLTLFTVTLYLGDEEMKNLCYAKVPFAIGITFILLGCIIAVWCYVCVKETPSAHTITHDDLTITTEKQIVVISSKGSKTQIRCYKTFDEPLYSDIQNGDTIYIFNNNGKISADVLRSALAAKKDIVFQFVDSTVEIK